MLNTLENLIKLARERKLNPVDGSYTNKLLTDKSLSKAKVLEEVNELIEAIDENSNIIHEAADVFYHLLMYLEANDVKIEEVMSELEKRKK
jgi:phosphoribosyl-ATP pyrophosphohydrolase